LDAAAASVGRAILVSGLTVMVALAGLLITGQGDFLSIGLGTIVVVLIAVLGSLTVLPAVLALLGDRVDRARVPGYRSLLARKVRREAATGRRSGPWAALARAVTAHPGASLVTAACVLATLAVPLFGMRTAALGIADLPSNVPVVQATHAIERAFPGAPQDAELVVAGIDLGTARAHEALVMLGERAVRATGGRGEVTVAVSADGRLARVDVPMPDRSDDAEKAAVLRLRSQVAPTAAWIPGAHGDALVTGAAASGVDYSARMATATPEVIGFVLALGFLLLLVTFQAPLLAAAMMLLNLLSIGAAYGILTAVFQHTWAEHLFGFHSTGHIINWLPLFLFVVLFGLSMDYTVLVLERIREARLEGLGPRQAAAEGVAATAGTVTSAAIVMVAVFSIFATLDVINFKQLGVGLAAAVLLDATLVRGVALPATVALLGERGWPVRRPRTRAAGESLRAERQRDDEVVLAGHGGGRT
jgi:RND superfamily putative drug exporter